MNITYTSWSVDGIKFTNEQDARQAARHWALIENRVKYLLHRGPHVSTYAEAIHP